jgi:uncharacterized protein DUF4129
MGGVGGMNKSRHGELRDHNRGLCVFVLVFCALFTVQFFLSSHIAYADDPLTLSEYKRVVERALTLVTQAASQPAGRARRSFLTQAAEALGAVHVVQLDGGERITITNARLVDDLGSPTADTTNLRSRLQALRDALDGTLGAFSADDQAKLRDLLNRPPFTQEIDPLTHFINELLARLFGEAANGVYESRYLIVALGLVLIALVLTYFFVNLRRTTVGESVLKTATLDGEAHLTSNAARDSAQRLASAGDYRSAVRQLYLSTLLWLDEHGRLRYDRSLTNREYLRAVANLPNMRDALKPIVETFDRIWYGFVPITASEFEAYQREVETIRNL